jgi:chloride channel protein, CIC family
LSFDCVVADAMYASPAMTAIITQPAVRLRVLSTRFFRRIGLGEDSFLLILAVLVGVVTAFAAVGFHETINFIRDSLYLHFGPDLLYGSGMWLLVLFPAAGGLAVGLIARYVLRGREGHGIVDVMESVIRSSGFQHPLVAIEKILTSGITIGSGGSAGAEGPIVQIGAAIASGVGGFFGLARRHMPILTGCGCAAGISAIFNAPFGGVLFTLEVILQDFSIRAFTPIVVSSVIAQVTTLAIFQELAHLHHIHDTYRAIFEMPHDESLMHGMLSWGQVANFALLGVVCGFTGLAMTRLMYFTEKFFHNLRLPRPLVPALGGVLLGLGGVVYVLLFGRLLLHRLKPFDFGTYPSPAFYGDGYGVVQQLLVHTFPGYVAFSGRLLTLLIFLCVIKIVGTCLTLSSGGSGGVIAPSLFIGATAGGVLGILLQRGGHFDNLQPELYALVGMGAVLAAVVHAPLASILIVFELTRDYGVMLPAMLACVMATTIARVVFQDSIYTQSLRRRGLRLSSAVDLSLLRRLSIEQVKLEPAAFVRPADPFKKILDMTAATGAGDFAVIDESGNYLGMVVADDIKTALMEPEAIPLLTCGELLRSDIAPMKNTDDLEGVMETFTRLDVGRLPVVTAYAPNRVIGFISRNGLMRRYQEELIQAR